jgi:hypothetical protein
MASKTGRMAPPGYPNTFLTSWRSIISWKICPPDWPMKLDRQ